MNDDGSHSSARVWQSRAGRRALLLLLCLAFVAQGVFTARENSLANDEAKHLVTGWWLLKTGDCCLGVDNTPLTAWFALPLLGLDIPETLPDARRLDPHAAGRVFLFNARDPQAVLLAGRVMSILAGLLMLIAVAVLADRLFGPPAGLLASGILAFEPNVVAHFSLVSTDALFAATAVVFLLVLDRALTKPSNAAAALTGATLGLALIAKFTALALLPATALLLFLYRVHLRERPAWWWISRAGLSLVVALAVVWVAYGAHTSARFPFIAIPGFIEGLAQVKGLVSGGFMAYYFGETGRYWPSYFLGGLALKTPIAELVLWLAAMAASLTLAVRHGLERRLAPAAMAAFFLALGLVSHLNIGIRHVLTVYVLAAVASGALAGWRPRWLPRKAVTGALVALVFALSIESLRIAPHTLSYFNQFAGGPLGGIRYLGDSNLDWGQDLKTLKRVMDRERIDEVILAYLGTTDPEFYGIRYQYLPHMFYGSTNGDRVVDSKREILAVSTNNLQGIVSNRTDYAWLRKRTPFTTAGYSIYLYDITGDAAAHAQLASIYSVNDLPVLAAKERAKVEALRLDGARGAR